MMRLTVSITILCLMFVILLNLTSSSPVLSEGKDTKLLSRIRRQIWGGSYNMIFGRQQCDDKPCLVDEECCRGYSCFNPKQLTSRQAKSLGVCLDDVDILRLEAELLS